jgi:hypothetical protein
LSGKTGLPLKSWRSWQGSRDIPWQKSQIQGETILSAQEWNKIQEVPREAGLSLTPLNWGRHALPGLWSMLQPKLPTNKNLEEPQWDLKNTSLEKLFPV